MNYNQQQQSQSVPSYVVNQFARLPDGRPNPLLAQFTAGLVKNLGAIKFDPRAGLTEEDRYLIEGRQKLAQQAIEINRQLAEQQVQAEKMLQWLNLNKWLDLILKELNSINFSRINGNSSLFLSRPRFKTIGSPQYNNLSFSLNFIKAKIGILMSILIIPI